MTFEEKVEKLDKLCSDQGGCDNCPCRNHITKGCFVDKFWHECTEQELDKALKYFDDATHDVVNHPSHYCREGAMESIDEMKLIFGGQAVKHFCLLNAWKYRYRASAKNGDEDLKKSDWYIRKYKELVMENADEYDKTF